MTTGMGRSRMIFSRNSSPFILGISTSRVMTSGFSSLILARASSGSAAVPTTLISGSRRRTALIRLRMVALSSTTRTETALMPPLP